MSHMISVIFHGRGRPGGFCASLAEARAVLETLGHHQFEISATSRAGAIFLGESIGMQWVDCCAGNFC